MNVILVGNYLNDHQESMQRFAALLASELPRRGVKVELLRPEPFFGRVNPAATGVGKWLGYIDKFGIFPLQLKSKLRQLSTGLGGRNQGRSTCGPGLPVVHICDHSNAPYVRFLRGIPHIVTVHDLLAVRSAQGEFLENPTRWSGRVLQMMIREGLRRCALAACISEATRADLYRLAGRTPADTTVIPNGLNYPYSPLSPKQVLPALDQLFARLHTARPERYILHVGGNSWYKNRPGVLHAFFALKERMPQRNVALVMAGTPPSRDLVELCAQLGIAEQVHWLGKVSNPELHALYSGAEALLFPSLAEGFGWPLIEAQACGCPVVTSSRAPMTEVAGAGALLFDPEDPISGALCLERLLREDSGEREHLREAGLTNARRFSTERMIDGYLDLYIQTAETCAHRQQNNPSRGSRQCAASQ